MSFVIEVGKKYLHTSGKFVTVSFVDKGVYGVIDSSGSLIHAFASELQFIEKIEQIETPKYESPVEPIIVGHQTIIGSIVESWVNIVIGFIINFTANMVILPMFGFHELTLAKNFEIGMLYTVISLVRSFVIRRYFNRIKWGNNCVERVTK